MFYTIQNGVLTELDTSKQVDSSENQYLGVIGYDEIFASAEGIGLKNTTQVFSNKNPRFEAHLGYDLMCFEMIDCSDCIKAPVQFYVYLKDNLLLFIGDDTEKITAFIESFMNDSIKDLNFGRVLAMLLDRMTEQDYALTEVLDREIIAIDDMILTSKYKDCMKHITYVRKKLLRLKQYYQRLSDIFDKMAENENEILDERSISVVKILIGRIDRMHENILHLSESVNHLRESYQSEADIELNNTMKILTVMTSIFLPLTLITGWYGMNLKMPEYSLSFGYPLIIALSVVVLLIIVILFKKNKWM